MDMPTIIQGGGESHTWTCQRLYKEEESDTHGHANDYTRRRRVTHMDMPTIIQGGGESHQGWVQLYKITSITITLKYKLQLHLHNVVLNYNYTMFISITITDQIFSRKLHLYLWNFC